MGGGKSIFADVLSPACFTFPHNNQEFQKQLKNQKTRVMKKLVFLAAICFAVSVSAQSNKEDIDLIQAAYGKEKKEIVAAFIEMEDGAKKDAFWKLYDQYETERKRLGRKRIALLEKYAANYDSMHDLTTSKNIKETAALGLENDKLIQAYHLKIEKAAGVKPAAQFFQIESYFLSGIRVAILENIPFIGELK